MPLVNYSDISDIRIGDVKAGALLAGSNLVWNRRVAVSEYSGAGAHTVQVPSWANFMTVLLVGGGASGIAAQSIFGLDYGGAAGEVALNGVSVNSNSTIRLIVGAGGGTSTSGQNPGSPTRVDYANPLGRTQRITAAGGAGQSNRASSVLNGSYTAGISPQENKYVTYHTGGGGIPPGQETTLPSNGYRNGVRGAGGSSKSGGSRVGAGGDGYAQIVFFGIDPLIGSSSNDSGAIDGNFRGEWAEGVQYRAGDTFTYQGARYRAKQSHTSTEAVSPAYVDVPGIAQTYIERI